MKKRFLTFILAGVLSISMTGCGPNPARLKSIIGGNEGTNEEISAVASSEGSIDVNDGSSSSGSTSESSTDEFYRTSDGAPVYMTLTKYYYKNADDESSTNLYEGHNESLVLIDSEKEKFPELDNTLSELYKEQLALMDSKYEEGVSGAQSDLESGYLNGNYSDTYDLNLKRSDSSILSYYYDFYTFSNGAHGSYGIVPYTIDVKTGKKLDLSDIITIDNDKLHEILLDKIRASATERDMDPDETFWELEDTLSHYQFEEKINNDNKEIEDMENPYFWYLDNDGIHFYFGIYEIAAYAFGPTDVVIGYDEMKDIFNPDRLPVSEGKGYIVNIGMPYESMIDIDCDGEKEKVTVEYGYNEDDYTYADSVTLKVDEETTTIKDLYLDTRANFTKYYQVHTKDNRNYLYIVTADMNDYYFLYAFDLNDNKLTPVKTESGYPYSFTLAYVSSSLSSEESGEICMADPESFYLGSRYDLFGTFTTIGRYHVGADGLPESDSNVQPLSWHIAEGIASKEDITADIVEENGDLISENEVITKGEKFIPLTLYIDGDDYSLIVKLSDGRFARLKYSNHEYPYEINGKATDDLFEDLQYAG